MDCKKTLLLGTSNGVADSRSMVRACMVAGGCLETQSHEYNLLAPQEAVLLRERPSAVFGSDTAGMLEDQE